MTKRVQRAALVLSAVAAGAAAVLLPTVVSPSDAEASARVHQFECQSDGWDQCDNKRQVMARSGYHTSPVRTRWAYGYPQSHFFTYWR